jgi:hypothetical protein
MALSSRSAVTRSGTVATKASMSSYPLRDPSGATYSQRSESSKSGLVLVGFGGVLDGRSRPYLAGLEVEQAAVFAQAGFEHLGQLLEVHIQRPQRRPRQVACRRLELDGQLLVAGPPTRSEGQRTTVGQVESARHVGGERGDDPVTDQLEDLDGHLPGECGDQRWSVGAGDSTSKHLE